MIQALPTVIRGGKEREHERSRQAENFVYGVVGNRLRGPGHSDASVYNELNQLLANKTEEFRYDAAGNLIYRAGRADDGEDDYEQQGWSYEYDLENRLVKASKIGEHGSRAISFKYDPFGRRIEKRVEEAEHGKTESRITTYVYDNEDIILEISGNKTSRYVHGPGIDEPLAVEQKRNTCFFHADGLGSIVNLTDQRGRVVQSYEYSSFGRMKEQGEVKQVYGFTGREWDKETGLYYYRARYYDPKGGRFISKDPIGFAGGDMNLYRYVGNDPVSKVDPFGLFRTSIDVYHQSCLKLPLGSQRCECHCAYASDYSGCVNKCMECFSSTKPLSPQDLCKCTCKKAGLTDGQCKILCKEMCK